MTGVTWSIKNCDHYGRPTQVADTDVQLDLSYDVLGRLNCWKATDLSTGNKPTLTTTLAWDTLDREDTRTVTSSSSGNSWSLTSTYNVNHQLAGKTLKRNGNSVRVETYTYDARNRLTEYDCSGTEPAQDSKGLAIQNRRSLMIHTTTSRNFPRPIRTSRTIKCFAPTTLPIRVN
ncbi:hypothetical protein HED54_20145 [Ochrobactrum anthropi ATCC 49188]|nr:hypothetical protein [Brucella anthropi ATCC 49188]